MRLGVADEFEVDRFHVLRAFRGGVRRGYDIPRRAQVRKEEPNDLPLDLQYRRLDLHHGYQRLRHRYQAYSRRPQPTRQPIHLRLRHRGRSLHSSPDELLQQSAEPIQHEHVHSPHNLTHPPISEPTPANTHILTPASTPSTT